MRIRLALFLTFAAAAPAAAQQPYTPKVVTADDYARAEKSLATALTPLATGGSVSANWLPDDRLWYRNTTLNGSEVILVDPAKKTRMICDATLSSVPVSPPTPTPPPVAGAVDAAVEALLLGRRSRRRPTANSAPSSRTTISGCATSRPVATGN